MRRTDTRRERERESRCVPVVGHTHEEVEDADSEHLEDDADVTLAFEPVEHLDTHAKHRHSTQYTHGVNRFDRPAGQYKRLISAWVRIIVRRCRPPGYNHSHVCFGAEAAGACFFSLAKFRFAERRFSSDDRYKITASYGDESSCT